jgi:beta-glucosidase
LLKNKKFLPLIPEKLNRVAIIGANATARFASGGGAANIKAPYEITALEGISNRLGSRVEIIYAPGYVAPTGRGRRDRDDTITVAAANINLIADAVMAASKADVVIYVGGLNHNGGYDTEGTDRRDLKLPAGQDELLDKIVAANSRTVVVLMGGGAVEMGSWLERVPAVLYTWYPGMEGGNALARVLCGDFNPSGRLPCTFPKRLADSPAHALGAYPGTNGTVTYVEGLLVGYRWFDAKQIEPLFPFGHGLSYTEFKYSNLKIGQDKTAPEPIVSVTFDLANRGKRSGAEVAQIYVQPVKPSVQRPPKELKNVGRIQLEPGQKLTVAIPLDRTAFSFYDPNRQAWVAEKGTYKILVGSSSRDIRLQGECKLETTTVHP